LGSHLESRLSGCLGATASADSSLQQRGVSAPPAARSRRTVRRRLAALSSLFSHLVDRQIVTANPVREIRRPRVNRKQGTTAAFSPAQARKLLDAPDATTLQGLRDRAILSVGLQVGPIIAVLLFGPRRPIIRHAAGSAHLATQGRRLRRQ